MNWTDHGEHILTLDDYFDDILIDEIINDFDKADELGLTLQRTDYGGNPLKQKDTSMFYTQMSDALSGRTKEIVDSINKEINYLIGDILEF